MKKIDESGATTLEVAITLVPFLLLILGIVWACLTFYTAFTLQFSVNNTVRSGIISGDSLESMQEQIRSELSSYDINSDSLRVTLCKGIVNNCTNYEIGASNSFITLQATVNSPEIFGLGFPVTGRVVAKNEPF